MIKCKALTGSAVKGLITSDENSTALPQRKRATESRIDVDDGSG